VWSRSNITAYGDLDVNDTDGAWTLGSAVRVESFDDFGTTTNGKVSARVAFFRAGVSIGFRAPTPGQRNGFNISTIFEPAVGDLVNNGTIPSISARRPRQNPKPALACTRTPPAKSCATSTATGVPNPGGMTKTPTPAPSRKLACRTERSASYTAAVSPKNRRPTCPSDNSEVIGRRSSIDAAAIRSPSAAPTGHPRRVPRAAGLPPSSVRSYGGNGADVVFECAGGSPRQGLAGSSTLGQAIKAVRSGGKLVVVSWFGAPLEIDVDGLRERSLRLIFPDISSLAHLEHTVRLVASGRIRLGPMLTHFLQGIESVREAFEITANKAKYGAINPAQVSMAASGERLRGDRPE